MESDPPRRALLTPCRPHRRRTRRLLPLLLASAGLVFALASPPAEATTVTRKIILIGGKKSHGPGAHDFPGAITHLTALLQATPAFSGFEILDFPSGFPSDLSVLENAAAVLLYFDGVMEKPEPLLDPARIAALQKLMDAGSGLIALHQASTLPAGDQSVPLLEWLGAKRDGMFDRTTQTTSLRPANPAHPVSSGVGEFTYRDEFYPTLVFAPRPGRLTPVLVAELTPESGESMTPNSPPPVRAERVVAWAFERPAGGRAFGFTGLHYLNAFSLPHIRQLLLNALAWTARIEVPPSGITTTSRDVPIASGEHDTK